MAIGWAGSFVTDIAGYENSLVRAAIGGGVCLPLYIVYLLLFEKKCSK